MELMTATMQALVLAEYGRMSVEARPVPALGPGDALLRILFTGICGSDLHGYTGENCRRSPGQVMGHETVARIAELPPGYVGSLHVGQLVTIKPPPAVRQFPAAASGRQTPRPPPRSN